MIPPPADLHIKTFDVNLLYAVLGKFLPTKIPKCGREHLNLISELQHQIITYNQISQSYLYLSFINTHSSST